MLLLLFGCLKRFPIVEIDNGLAVEMEQHIRLAVVVDILKADRHWRKLRIRGKDSRPNIHLLVFRIAALNLDDLNLAVEIKRNKVRWMKGTVVMPDNRITLIGSRHPVVEVIDFVCNPLPNN